ncbi:zinc finger protein protein, putative [Babesia ovis]|uniref:E3 ubiquitin-protein ligase n=1 Tax=Babesia ovis TaxID=5869 RepID=A0A9W5TAR9_BABOV|nr:zinc finger protein protein, putative [Babesia ovis]
MAELGVGKRQRATYAVESLDIRALGERYYGNHDVDAIFQEIYAYLYPNCCPQRVNRLMDSYTGTTGHCTTKWMEETVAFKCYDCESDSTCAICLECFFRSNHEGHRFRLTRTSGGCCDCGDNGSWALAGSCSRHNSPLALEDEKQLLDLFNQEFISRLHDTFRQIIEAVTAYMSNLEVMQEQFIFVLMMFLDDLLKVTPAYRYAFFEVMTKGQLKLWMRKHQVLPIDIRKTFNSLYLTMVTLMSFKHLFSSVYIEIYPDIVQPFDDTDEWHLTHLSVQLFTYPYIANRAVASGFIQVCMASLMDHHPRDAQLDTLQFPRFDRGLFGLYLVILSDFSYIMAHESVVKQVFSSPDLYVALFDLIKHMNMMNTIQMARHEHVSFENTGYAIAFTSEHTLHSALRHFSDYCKVDVHVSAGLYRALNDYMVKNLTRWEYNSPKLCRTFHIPFVRFFASVVNFNHIRILYGSNLNRSMLNDDPLVTAFDDSVLLYIMKTAISTLGFSQEIKHNLWVYNGESMHDQNEHYRQVVLVQMDIAALQIAITLLGLRRLAGLSDIDPLLVLHSEVFDKVPLTEDGIPDVGDKIFRIMLFMQLLNVVLHDLKHLEKLSVKRDGMDPDYIRRGYPLVMMDVVTALATGRLEFSEVTGSVDTYWRYHPHIVKAIESVATTNYSEMASKAYLRPKNETYRMVDVNWNPYDTTSDISLPNEILKRGNVGLLGPRRKEGIMAPEFYQTQDAILTALGSYNCYSVALELIQSFSGEADIARSVPKDNTTVDVIHFRDTNVDIIHSSSDTNVDNIEPSASMTSLQKTELLTPTQKDKPSRPAKSKWRYFKGIDWASTFGSKWNASLFCALKTIILILETSRHIDHDSASRLVDILEALNKRIEDDRVMNTTVTYVIQRLRETFQIDQKETDCVMSETRKQAIKRLQKRFMAHVLAQQNMLPRDEAVTTPVTKDEAVSELETCILCKQGMDDNNPMSFMCLISTNSVLRRCTKSSGRSSVYAKASLPLRSSMISCCGHTVHTKCILHHNKNQAALRNISYGVQRATDEFYCPICKALCNYMLEYVPDTKCLQKRAVNREDKIQKLSAASWRYVFCANWIPSPILARFNVNPHVMYTFNVVLPSNVKNRPKQGRSFLEDLGIPNSQDSKFSCAKCQETNLALAYQPKCGALFFAKETKVALVDRRYFLQQFQNWLFTRPSKQRQLEKLLSINLDYRFSTVMTTEYCRVVFGGQRCLYGIQNWRHVNAGTFLDPKFWMFYHYVLATCSCRRNQLTVRPSLLQHLVRNLYNTGLRESLVESPMDINNLDNNYFDIPADDLVVPGSMPAFSETTVLGTLVDSMTDIQLRTLGDTLGFEIKEGAESQSEQFNTSTNNFDLDVTSAWSKDPIREFLYFFMNQGPTLEASLGYLSECIGMLMMQVLERVVLKDIQRSFSEFVCVHAIDVEPSGTSNVHNTQLEDPLDTAKENVYSTLKFHREFLSTLYKTYIEEYIHSAEIPADLLDRVQWLGFEQHVSDFRRYNNSNIVGATTDDNVFYDCQTDEPENQWQDSDVVLSGGNNAQTTTGLDLNTFITRRKEIEVASKMQQMHHTVVSSFTHPLPQEPSGNMAGQVRGYIHDMVNTLLKVRRVHAIVESGLDDLQFDSMIKILQTTVGHQDSSSPRLDEEDDAITKVVFSKPTPSMGAPATVSNPEHQCPPTEESEEPERTYRNMDFIKRANEQTYRAHCNFAFFEVLRHLVPAERHLLDFVDTEIIKHLENIDISESSYNVLSIAREMAKQVYQQVRAKGYLHHAFEPDIDAYITLLVQNLNSLLDIAFWTIYSVFDTTEELMTKVSYANLHANNVRFDLLAEVTGIYRYMETIAASCKRMFNFDTRLKLDLVRATGHETAAPLVTGYNYVDMQRNLPADAWELIQQTTLRKCPNCGETPAHPLVCLLCGSVVCHQSKCCDRSKETRVLHMLITLERNNVAFRPTDLAHIYNGEVLSHTRVCGGGQCVFISPYNGFLLLMDDTRHCVTPTLYADKYGNKDLHSNVYGPVMLSQTRLTNVINTFCQGRLAHEIINAQKEAAH